MIYNFEKQTPIDILHLEGNLLGAPETQNLLDEITQKIEENNKLFIVDLKEVKFINSMGLNMLLSILTKVRKAGGEVVLINIPEQLSKLLVITKLTSVFHILDNREIAMEKLKAL